MPTPESVGSLSSFAPTRRGRLKSIPAQHENAPSLHVFPAAMPGRLCRIRNYRHCEVCGHILFGC